MLIMFRDFYLHFNTLIVFVIVLKLYQRKFYCIFNMKMFEIKEKETDFFSVAQPRETLRSSI